MGSLVSFISTEVISALFLFTVEGRIQFIDSRSVVGRVSSEGDIHKGQEFIHSIDQILWSVSHTIRSRGSFINNDLIGEISCHDEIMLHDEGCLFGIQDISFDDSGGYDSLFRI